MENPTIDWVKQSGRLDGFTPVALRSSKFKLTLRAEEVTVFCF